MPFVRKLSSYFSRNLCIIFDPLPTGDGDYKPYVSCDPDVTTVEMDGSEDFAVVACDGLWDTVTPEDAARTVLKTVAEEPGELFKRKHCFSSFGFAQTFEKRIGKPDR